MAVKRRAGLLGSRRRRLILAAGLGGLLLLVGWLFLGPFWRLTSEFDDLTYRQPSRLYARPLRLEVGRLQGRSDLVADLRSEGYRAVEPGAPLPPGRYRSEGRTVTVHLRSFRLPDGRAGGGLLAVRFRGDRVERLERGGTAVEAASLDPPLIASYYGPDFKERRPVSVDEVPEDLVHAVLAAEDASFFRHSGLSFRGMARAAWVNARGRELRQGGSTLTQQLVKNLYLTQERTLTRKSQEVVLSLLLELRYGKREILEAYLNEIYLGASNGVNLLGVGAAARAFFGKDASQLDLAESATLAGIISSPAGFSPTQRPERCRERRDWVLARMTELRLVEPERARAAAAEPLSLAPEPVVRRRAPYFADAMAQEAERRFGIDDLADGGYVLVSTLDWKDQQAAHETLAETLPQLEKREARKDGAPLQAALVSVDPASGGIRAYVGGRRYAESQFDRASQARRQAGSVFKPIVYAALFEAGAAMPASFVEDSPLTVPVAGGKPWSPKNDDGGFHGWVTVRSALERSYNPATARLALQVGMDKVVALARAMGVSSPLSELPSVALGAAEVTPVELAGVYATFAAGGTRPPVHGLTAVFDRYGKPVPGTRLPAGERALSAESCYLVTSLLQGVIERGTGRAARAQGVRGELAGKTGTTNKRRDNWFAGYAPERATVVWVGYDDNAPTRLSGARAALPIWSRFTAAVRPPGGYSTFRQPSGITTASIDPSTGRLATEFCPGVITEVFRQGESPTELCDRHQGWLPEQMAEAAEAGMDPDADEGLPGEEAEAREERRERRGNAVSRWFRRVFGSDERDRGNEGDGERPPGP